MRKGTSRWCKRDTKNTGEDKRRCHTASCPSLSPPTHAAPSHATGAARGVSNDGTAGMLVRPAPAPTPLLAPLRHDGVSTGADVSIAGSVRCVPVT